MPPGSIGAVVIIPFMVAYIVRMNHVRLDGAELDWTGLNWK